jgi:hypothetical protein
VAQNKELKKQLASLRGCMLSSAEGEPLSNRFIVISHDSQPRVIIGDITTGRTSEVSLCDYYGVRKTLNDLFGHE